MDAKRFKAAEKLLAKAHTSDSTKALGKLAAVAGGRRQIIGDPPLIVPVEEVFSDVQASAIYQQIRTVLGQYGRSLQSDRRAHARSGDRIALAAYLGGSGKFDAAIIASPRPTPAGTNATTPRSRPP